jgi:hypothetical protein
VQVEGLIRCDAPLVAGDYFEALFFEDLGDLGNTDHLRLGIVD